VAPRPDTLESLVELFESTWRPYYVDGPGNARRDLLERAGKTGRKHTPEPKTVAQGAVPVGLGA
jgi:hypothetical protein